MYFEEVGGVVRVGFRKHEPKQLQIIIATNTENGVFLRVPITHTPHHKEREKSTLVSHNFRFVSFLFARLNDKKLIFRFLFCGGVGRTVVKLVVNVF